MSQSREFAHSATPPRTLNWKLTLAVVFVGAALLRFMLIVRGGQFFWPDEARYLASRRFIDDWVRSGSLAEAAETLLQRADHLLFKIIGILPASLEHQVGDNPLIPALFFGLFSAANVPLVGYVARQFGASPRTSLIAAVLAAVAGSLFYYSRHLLPYDVAMFFCLGALVVGRREKATGIFAAGFLVGLGFLAYNGAWLMGGVVLVLLALQQLETRTIVKRAAVGAVGLALAVGAMVLAGRLVGSDLVQAYLAFSRTITQGDFGDGGRVLIEYLWAADAGLLLATLLMLPVLVTLLWERHPATGGFVRWGLAAVAVGGGLILLSDVFAVFTVYGRTARQIVPFLCLLLAFGIGGAWQLPGWRAATARAALAVAVFGGLRSIGQPLRQVFPAEFQLTAATEARRAQEQEPGSRYRIIYTDYIHGLDSIIPQLPEHSEILSARHPLQFRPYLFEGYNRRQREALDRTNIAMRLIRLEGAAEVLDSSTSPFAPYPGALEIRFWLPADQPRASEPLLVTGVTGKGNLVYLFAETPALVRIGYDYWGIGGFLSEPLPAKPGEVNEAVISIGALYPPDLATRSPGLAPLTTYVYAAINGEVALARHLGAHAIDPRQISLGSNLIGSSTTGSRFSGRIEAARPLTIEETTRLLPSADGAPD